ncbi:MAG: AMP-binding protein [Acidimicrobiia bacterium]|nr:AMP-binding protein [Acidimicrobiia bacterium]
MTEATVDIGLHIDEALAASYRAAGWWRDRTYLDDFADAVAARPDKVAIVGHRHDRSAAAPPTVLTYRQLDRYVDRFAGALVDLGVQPGRIVSVQLPNDWVFAALALACGRIGAVINPLVPIFRERELGFILGRTESPVLVVPGSYRGYDHAAMADRVLANLAHPVAAFAVGADQPSGRVEPFDERFLARRWEDEVPAERLRRDALGPDDLAELQFTSGTTGEPKGVMHTSNTIFAGTRAFADTVGLTDQDSIIMPSTLAHQTGFLVGIVLPLAAGMKVVYQDLWDAEVFCRLVDDEQVSFSAGATPFLTDIVAACQRRGRPLASMRSYLCAGAPIPSPLVEAAKTAAVGELIALWGMTENGAVTLTAPGDPVELVADSDGTPVAWMDVRIVDDDGREVPVGGVGRLLVRGASQTPGYFKRPDIYAAQLSVADDGGAAWFDTGDLARRRPDGGVRIAGRTKDLVIRGGENIPVVEVEAVLFGHPKVREVAVIGYPDERLGERACAVVVAEGEPPTLAELTGWLDGKGMAKQFWPERIEVVDDMPKTPSGKIQKFHLRERFGT